MGLFKLKYSKYIGLGYCFISKDLKQLTESSTCRAYLLDVFQCERIGNNAFDSVCWKRKDGEIDKENVRIGYKTFKPEVTIHRVLDFLNKFENAIGFEPTVVYKCEDRIDFFMFVGDKRWQLSPALLSLYTVFMRNCYNCHRLKNSLSDTLEKMKREAEYDLKNSIPYIEKIVKYGIEPFFYDNVDENWSDLFPYTDTHGFGIHSYSYFQNFYEHRTVKYKLWKRGHMFANDQEIEAWIAENKMNKEYGDIVIKQKKDLISEAQEELACV